MTIQIIDTHLICLLIFCSFPRPSYSLQSYHLKRWLFKGEYVCLLGTLSNSIPVSKSALIFSLNLNQNTLLRWISDEVISTNQPRHSVLLKKWITVLTHKEVNRYITCWSLYHEWIEGSLYNSMYFFKCCILNFLPMMLHICYTRWNTN